MTGKTQRVRMATGALSHLIGAYYLIGSLICDCEPKDDPEMRQLLLHLKGIFWSIMTRKYGIRNPRKIEALEANELLPPQMTPRPIPGQSLPDTGERE